MKDIIVTTDLMFENGDFLIDNSENQHIKHILTAYKGEFKEFPEIGVGIDQLLNSDEYMSVFIDAKRNLEYDGATVGNISITPEGKLNVDAKYKN